MTYRDLGYDEFLRKTGSSLVQAPPNPFILQTGMGTLDNVNIEGGSDVKGEVTLDGNVTADRVNSWTEPWTNEEGGILELTKDYWVRKITGGTGVAVSSFFNNDYLNNADYRLYDFDFFFPGDAVTDIIGLLINWDKIDDNTTAVGHLIRLDANADTVNFFSRASNAYTFRKGASFSFTTDRYYNLRVIVYDNETAPWMRVFIDGSQVFEVSNADFTPAAKEGYYGMQIDSPNSCRFKDFKIGGINVIYGDLIVTGTITASKLNVSELSAISADLGTITAGTVTGALFQTTSTANSGIKFDSTSFRAYDASGDEVVTIDPSTGKGTFKDLSVANGNVWIPSFYAPDESATLSYIGNGDDTSTPTIGIMHDLNVKKYSGLTYLKSRLTNQDNTGLGAAAGASYLGVSYYGTAGISYRNNIGGDNVLVRTNSGAAGADAWTAVVGRVGGANATLEGCDTDGTRCWCVGESGVGTYSLYNKTFAAGAATGNSANNANLGNTCGVVYYSNQVYVFSYSIGGVSKISIYDNANTPVLQSTTTLSDDSFSGLIVFRVDNTGNVYCMPDGAYDTNNRNIHYLLDLNDL